jgi:DNA-binding NarL/FixJ family response regulator
MRVRVLLAEDHQAVAEELGALLRSECDVVGMVADGLSLVASARALRPDVIVADITMPTMDGLEAAGRILREDAASRIVFVTVHADPAMVERGFAVGAVGYVLKQAAGEDLLPAVRAAVLGERYVSPLLGEKLANGT